MMRANFIKFLSQTAHVRDKCRILSNTITTSQIFQSRTYERSKVNARKEEYFDKSRKSYEDTFGNLDSFETKFQRIKEDPEDILEYEREKLAQGKKIIQYITEIKAHLDKYDYESALKVLEVDMVNDKKKVCTYIYKVLINYNAKQGNLEEAYRLFINFKKRQGIVTGAMYTSMFNACANCKNSYLAIEKADAIQECMRHNKYHSINTSNYNVMLKAYGRHGDLVTCLKIVDEVLEHRNKVKADTYNFLLQACISDKNSGLRHALLVWRKMIQNRVKPDIWSFNTMLKCVQECSLGDASLVSNLIQDVENESGKFFKRKVIVRTLADGQKIRKGLKIQSTGDDLITPVEEEVPRRERDFININASRETLLEGENSDNLKVENETKVLESHESGNELCESNEKTLSTATESEEIEEYSSIPIDISQKKSDFPNLIALKPTVGAVVNIGVMTQPHHRFLLLGGIRGFLKTMTEFGAKPNTKTFTLLLGVIPSDFKAEEELLSIAKDLGIELDTPFFNFLIKRRFVRNEDSTVKDCLELMYSLRLKPDIITFGTLAIGCRTHELGMDLIKTIRNNGYRSNTEILETLLSRAIYAKDMKYILDVIRTAKEDETDLSKKFIAQLNWFLQKQVKQGQKETKSLLEASSPIPQQLSES